jgi:hypothetical protein
MRALIAAALSLAIIPLASAQQRQQFSFTPPPGTSKFEEQHAIDVGDVPGHQVRVFSLHSVNPQEAPVFDGVKVKEAWQRSMSDYTNLSGHVHGYVVYAMDNGDKVFARSEGLTQTTTNPDGSKASEYWGVTTLTGGTGKFKGLRGTLHSSTKVDFKGSPSFNSPIVGEYWFEQ